MVGVDARDMDCVYGWDKLLHFPSRFACFTISCSLLALLHKRWRSEMGLVVVRLAGLGNGWMGGSTDAKWETNTIPPIFCNK